MSSNLDRIKEALHQLETNQRQMDADGTYVAVSRQALEEVLEYLSGPVRNKWFSEFNLGQEVQRRNTPSGSPPAYRFKGTVCGSYIGPNDSGGGAVVSLDHDPGCKQIFPDYMLEKRDD